jgi:nicotinamidase-related amidase
MTTTSYPRETSVLVLVDPLNEFLADDGKINPMIRPMLDKLNLVASLERLVAGARAAGLPIVYAPHGLDDHSFDDVKHMHPRLQMAVDGQAFWVGTPGANFYPSLAPRDGDIVAGRHRMFNAFMGTDLEERLKQRGVERVVLAGLTSQTCVEGTGRHALEAGYHVTFLTDAVADFTDEAHNAALQVSYPTFGHAALTVDQFLDGLKQDA